MQQQERHLLWAIIRKKQRMVNQVTLPLSGEDPLGDPLTLACQEMDLERPVVLPKHHRDMGEFRRTTFKAPDFIDAFSYDALDIIHIVERKEVSL